MVDNRHVKVLSEKLVGSGQTIIRLIVVGRRPSVLVELQIIDFAVKIKKGPYRIVDVGFNDFARKQQSSSAL